MRYMLKILARTSPKSLARVTMSIFGSHDPDEAVKRMSQADIDGIGNFYLRWGASWCQAGSNDMDQTTEDAALNTIKAPTLIVHSRADAAVPFAAAEYSHANIPGSELWESPAWSHMTLGSEAAAVDTKVIEFLKKREPTTDGCSRSRSLDRGYRTTASATPSSPSFSELGGFLGCLP